MEADALGDEDVVDDDARDEELLENDTARMLDNDVEVVDEDDGVKARVVDAAGGLVANARVVVVTTAGPTLVVDTNSLVVDSKAFGFPTRAVRRVVAVATEVSSTAAVVVRAARLLVVAPGASMISVS